MTRISTFCLLVVFGFSSVGEACLWDRDTIRDEAWNNHGVVETIAGRFDRYPARYFEMRLERVARELADDPARLDLYDDAGVACDRLGRQEEAIEWCRKKKVVVDGLPAGEVKTTHLYRYHANLGTFVVHRWLREGASRERLDEVVTAKEHIAKAIEVNPDAHFGREIYQLRILEWIVRVYSMSEEALVSDPGSRSFLTEGNAWGRYLTDSELADEAVEGLSGIIRLGAGWESVDLFYCLQLALQARGDASLAMMAKLRREEIEAAGGKVLYPLSAKKVPFQEIPELEDVTPVKTYYQELREDTEAVRERKLAYLMEQFDQGKHPDTHPDFWDGYDSPEYLPMPKIPVSPTVASALRVVAIIAPILVVVILVYLLVEKVRPRRGVAAR